MSRWPGPRWPARVFLRTIGPHPGPRIISTWWKSYLGPAARWRPAAPCSRSGTRGGDQRVAKRTRADELRTRTNGLALHRWLSLSQSTGGTFSGVATLCASDGAVCVPSRLLPVPGVRVVRRGVTAVREQTWRQTRDAHTADKVMAGVVKL